MVQKTQVFRVPKSYLCVLVSMHVNDIFDFVAKSTIAPSNSMRTKAWSFERTTFLLQIWPKWTRCQGWFSEPTWNRALNEVNMESEEQETHGV